MKTPNWLQFALYISGIKVEDNPDYAKREQACKFCDSKYYYAGSKICVGCRRLDNRLKRNLEVFDLFSLSDKLNIIREYINTAPKIQNLKRLLNLTDYDFGIEFKHLRLQSYEYNIIYERIFEFQEDQVV
jgi:hypothetical protein